MSDLPEDVKQQLVTASAVQREEELLQVLGDHSHNFTALLLHETLYFW